VYDEILYEVNDPVATITFNRPERLNAFTERTLEELKHALAQAEQDERAVGIVITGSGRGFSAGMAAAVSAPAWTWTASEP
jgi:enoyl-CoA hydratase/carnithine racemase